MHFETSADAAFVDGLKWAQKYFKAARANEHEALHMGDAGTALRLLFLAGEFRDRANGLLMSGADEESLWGELIDGEGAGEDTPSPPRANTPRFR